MLSSDLLRARTSRGKLRVLWATGTHEELDLASELIETYKRSVGGTFGPLAERLDELESYYEAIGFDHKLIRGLSVLLERRCRMTQREVSIVPARARRAIFALGNRMYGGFVQDQAQMEQVLEEASKQLNASVEDVRDSLWADQQANLELTGFDSLDPEALLKHYNLSLFQTAIFRATKMKVTTTAPGRELKGLMWAIKRHGLMYSAKTNGEYNMNMEGPASLFKLTTRYGTSLAKLVPHVIGLDNWHLEATIVRGVGGRKRLLKLELTDERQALFPETSSEVLAFDSRVEREFSSLASALGEWAIEREPAPLMVDGTIALPDFSLSKGPLTIYVEIVGFWTSEYLERKIQKLSKLEIPMLVIANNDLSCSRLEEGPHTVLYYERSLKPREIIDRLREMEEKMWRDVRPALEEKLARLEISGDLVDLEELAEEIGATQGQVKALLESAPFEGYALVGNLLVELQFALSIRNRILYSKFKTLREASELFDELGIRPEYQSPLLSAAGFKILWKSLDEGEALLEPG